MFLADLVGAGSTLLGLAFALIAARTAFRYKGALRVMSVLPIITPPFVIGLALILLFGRAGAVSALLFDWFDIPRSRWIYGLPGVALAQLLAFTPIAFLVLLGVVQGISPSLEEASQTLRARGWTTFRTVTLPLLRPGLAAAFLLGFVESMADFGNPLVLGGNFEVLSTKIFFAVVGAVARPEPRRGARARAAGVHAGGVLCAAALARARVVHHGHRQGRRRAAGAAAARPALAVLRHRAAVGGAHAASSTAPSSSAASSSRSGRDYSFTLDHFLAGFAVEMGAARAAFHRRGLAVARHDADDRDDRRAAHRRRSACSPRGCWRARTSPASAPSSSARCSASPFPARWSASATSSRSTCRRSSSPAPAAILVICFVFRNMPVGVRAGIATLSQIDKSLDEASQTLGARSATTLRRVVLPLLRPAIVAALVYSFVRAMTAVSAVIFLVTAEYNMATAYIVGRVEAGEFGLAIAYSCVLIVIMLAVIGLIQLGVGERKLGRRDAVALQGAA